MKTISLIALSLLVFVVMLPAAVTAKSISHEKILAKYEGPGTCIACHKDAAREVTESLHYQMLGEPQLLESWPKGKLAGMMNTY